jgi:putative ABC transport system ATP-binding protein
MNILGCLDLPTAASIAFAALTSVRCHGTARAAASPLHRVRVQGFNLLNRTTALENVELPLVYRGVGALRAAQEGPRSARRRRSHRLGITHPGGALGRTDASACNRRAIVTEPSVLFADEPTGNLDTARSSEIMGPASPGSIAPGASPS